VTTEVLLDYLRPGRDASVTGRPSNVVSLSGVRATGTRRCPRTTSHVVLRTTWRVGRSRLLSPSSPWAGSPSGCPPAS